MMSNNDLAKMTDKELWAIVDASTGDEEGDAQERIFAAERELDRRDYWRSEDEAVYGASGRPDDDSLEFDMSYAS